MFKLIRLGSNDFAVITNKLQCRGTTEVIIKFLLTIWDISPKELQHALEDLIRTDCNIAEFGIMGRYVVSTKGEHLICN